MQLDRDEFVVSFDSTKVSAKDLTSVIRDAGYTSYVVSEDAANVGKDPPDRKVEPGEAAEDSLLADTLKQAQQDNKLVVLDFQAIWCVPCKRMEKETFADPAVAKLLKQVVFVKVDADEHAELTKQFGVVGLPDIRFLKPDGSEIGRLNDFQDAKTFAETLSKLLSTPMKPPQTKTDNTSSRQSLNDVSNEAEEFRQAFNAAKGNVRIVMLVSPG